jgi:nitrate reductase NapAB chaperone NapD
MLASISFNQSHKTSLSHNNRENTHGNPDIDVTRSNENIYFVKEDIRAVYQELFQEAVEAYNAKQSRQDRKIGDYYDKIHNDGKTHEQRELVVAIGEGKDGEEFRSGKKAALKKYAEEFQERNPHLRVYNMVLHDDEANPHLHINYVPHFENKKGLTRRVGMDKALQQQGVKGKGTELIGNWRTLETGRIEELAKEYLLNFERANVGSHKYMKVPQYKEFANEVERLEGRAEQAKEVLVKGRTHLKAVREEVDKSTSLLKNVFSHKDNLESELKEMEVRLESIKENGIQMPKIEAKESGILSKKVTISAKDYELLQETIKQVKNIPGLIQEKEKEVQEKDTEIQDLKDKLDREHTRNRFLNGLNRDLKIDNENLEREISRLNRIIELTKVKVAEFLDKVRELSKLSFSNNSKEFADKFVEIATKQVDDQDRIEQKNRENKMELGRD